MMIKETCCAVEPLMNDHSENQQKVVLKERHGNCPRIHDFQRMDHQIAQI